jgi:hypothetical protein
LCLSDAHIRFILFDPLEHTEVDKGEHIEGRSLNDRLRKNCNVEHLRYQRR